MRKTNIKRSYFLLCLFIAFACWFMMRISKTYSVKYDYDVYMKNVPEGKSVVYQSDSTLTLTLEDKGLSLLRADFGSKKLYLKYDELLSDYQKHSSVVHITNSKLLEYLKSDKRFGESLQNVNLSTINFRFESTSGKVEKK